MSISYYKYTEGESFTLNGYDYFGFFNVVNGIAYSGKTKEITSEVLTPKKTFLADFYLNSLDFDTCVSNIEQPRQVLPNTFDVFTKDSLDNILDTLNKNNLKIFKNLILHNPIIFDFKNTNSHFYGLSSTDSDDRNDDILHSKNVYTHIDPFEFDSQWNFLDNIKSGIFFVDSNDNFKYICNDDINLYTLEGNFLTSGELKLVNTTPSISSTLYYDDQDERLIITTDNIISIYDSSDYINCGTLNVIDSLSSSGGKIAFGKNLRIELKNSGIVSKNKYSNDVVSNYEFELDEIISFDIRNTDDYIIILGRKDLAFYFIQFDPTNYSNTLRIEEILEILDNSNNYNVKFSSVDSSIFELSYTEKFQTRLLSHPKYPVGELKSENLLYLDSYIYNTTFERFDKIQIKYNSNSLKSNYYNNLSHQIRLYSNYRYIILHNIGRIYVIKEPLNSGYLSSIPLNLEKSFFGISCSESSFGLYFNNSITNIIKDVLSLYANASKKFNLSINDVKYSELQDLNLEIENLYINGNETFNILSLQRIFKLINDTQKALLSTSTI
jgi:hypothetical protein